MKKLLMLLVCLVFVSPAFAGDWVSSGNDTYYNAGDVGVGTNSPSARLYVRNDDDSQIMRVYPSKNNGGSADFVELSDDRGFNGTNTGTLLKLHSYIGSSGNDAYLLRAVRAPWSVDEDVFWIKGSGQAYSKGNVGIGTTSPNQKLTVEGTVSLKEQAAANADTAAYGQLWVKNATPNELWFTNDAGTDTRLGAAGGAAVTDYMPVYNVKKDYGATGNGSTNDTYAIQDAILAAGDNGGGNVFLPEGDYYVSPRATTVKFHSGSTEPTEGETLTGATSGDTGTVYRVKLAYGS